MSLYDAAQLQRKAEREIRKDRRELVALSEIKDGNPSAQARFTKVSKRMKEHERDYEDFCRQTGLATQKERIHESTMGGEEKKRTNKDDCIATY